MGWFIIAGILSILVMCFVDDVQTQAGFICLLVFLSIAMNFVSGKENIYEETYHKVISVNGYYVDKDGNFVTEDNIRSTLSSPIIPENALVRAPYILKKYSLVNKSFWNFKQESTSYHLTFEYN